MNVAEETNNSETSTGTTETTQTEQQTQQTNAPENKTEAATVEAVTLTADNVKLPEGFEAHSETLTSFLDIMNDNKLEPGARAQALVDLQAKVLTQASEANSAAWDTLQTQWQDEVKADPDVGGAKLQQSLASVGKLVDQFGSPELRQVFDTTGAGNNVHVVKFLSKIASQLTEGGPSLGMPSGQAADAASRMFPSMKG